MKSIVNSRTAAYEYDYPFHRAKLRYPETAAPAQSIEPLSDERLNAIFRIGVGRGLLDEAMLPLLSVLTSRRLGLLVHLQGNDFREKYPGISADFGFVGCPLVTALIHISTSVTGNVSSGSHEQTAFATRQAP